MLVPMELFLKISITISLMRYKSLRLVHSMHTNVTMKWSTGRRTLNLLTNTSKTLLRKKQLFEAIQTVPCIERKANWALKWFDTKTRSFAERLFAFACVEGIFFSGSFCAIYWLKKGVSCPVSASQ